jgi:hypothetical protein
LESRFEQNPAMPQAENWDLLFMRPRLSGNVRRGWLLVALATVILAGAVAGIWGVDSMRLPPFVSVVCMAAIFVALVGYAAGVAELRRPIRLDFDGRCRRQAIDDAALRWHPNSPRITDDIQVLVRRTSGGHLAGFADAMRGKVVGRLLLDHTPLKTGERVRMRFTAKARWNWFVPKQFRFTLRCLRESPRPLFRLRSGIECLAAAKPAAVAFDPNMTAYELEFNLPTDAPGADLLAVQPVYWELTAESGGSTSAMRARFFLPVTP